jgi:hypothetical protein
MKTCLFLSITTLLLATFAYAGSASKTTEDGWQSLFNGKDLTGWKASETPGCFSVKDGELVMKGGRSHLFYTGAVNDADFTNFHFSTQVKTTPGSNSGIYFHTQYQQEGWPDKGYECQVNITHSDAKKSGGLYNAQDAFEQHAKDNEWYTQEIIVRDKHIITKINGKVVSDYTETEDNVLSSQPGRRLTHGTIAIQGHDPKSTVYFKDIKIKPLP